MFLSSELVSSIVASNATLQQGPASSYEILVVDEQRGQSGLGAVGRTCHGPGSG